ncbi:MAG: hypothetical protein Q9170_005258 [Blastenia crenularia]
MRNLNLAKKVKMAATSSGSKLKTTRIVRTTSSSRRKHRFESFNQRVAKLNIDPIHKTRHTDRSLNEDDTAASYFKTDLDKWKELNLSENFTNFVREVLPLCNTFPQVLHYQSNIAKILATYIERGDSLSLEPLLSLLSCFAHDLGSNFETYFSDTVTLVTSLATRHTDVEVIEWSFNCLAWLFKYLSRLLVPDLRPLLRIMSPLLGKVPHKLFTTRFAAEALSFLVRKAALVYHKNQRPLQNAISFILEDVDRLDREGEDVPLYHYGLKILLVDAIKGLERGLHSSGPTLYGFLLDATLSGTSECRSRMIILEGVTVGLIHHTEASTFQPVADHCLRSIQQQTKQDRDAHTYAHAQRICERLLCVLSTVRKGSRVLDWVPVVDALLALLKSREKHEEKPTPALCEAAVVIMQAAPLNVLISKVRPLMDRVANSQNQDQFLAFCDFFCQLNKERFESLIEPYFVKFLASQWHKKQHQLCLTLPKVARRNPDFKTACPASWQNEIVACFGLAERSEEEGLIAECYHYVKVLDQLSVSASTTDAIMRTLFPMIQTALKSPDQTGFKSIFSLGEGHKAYAKYESLLPTGPPRIWQFSLDAAPYYKTLPSFLEAVLISLSNDGCPTDTCLSGLVDQMIENLHSSSHELRGLSLQIINAASVKALGSEAEILATALTIESLPLDLKSARKNSMYIRRLASQYRENGLHHWLRKAIPDFCFGIQTFKLSSLWDDAIEVLKQICDVPDGEDIVSDLAFRLLETPDCQIQSVAPTVDRLRKTELDEFECSNLNDMDETFDGCVSGLENPKEKMVEAFWNSHTLLRSEATNAPAIALRVLLGIPQLAEKKSRRLVPVFLRWAAIDEDGKPPSEPSSPARNKNGDVDIPKLSGQDRKTMLRLFGLFTNPKVLYRSTEVFDALRNLLANGDVEIQKSALKAIFTWKDEALQPYQESLLNLLDDSRFRDEITTFLHAGDQTSQIQAEHRSQLVPILLRLLYGKLISRTGNQNARKTQVVKRKVILETLSRFDDAEIQEFLDIAVGSITQPGTSSAEGIAETKDQDQLSPRRQVGLLHMVRDLLSTLGSRLRPFTTTLARVVVTSTVRACQVLASENQEAHDQEGSQISLFKDIRQMGLQCINLMSQHCTVQEIQPYLPTLFANSINPRLDTLPIDTAQSVSVLLQLFSTWASSQHSVLFLVDYNPALLERISSSLDVQFAKDEVKTFVLQNILKTLVSLVEPEHGQEPNAEQLRIKERVLHPNIDVFLVNLGALLHMSPSKELLALAIECVTKLAPFVQGSSQTRNIVELASFLLTQPSMRVSPRTKGDLLQILHHLIPRHGFLEGPDLQEKIFTTISTLFAYFKDRNNRITLVQVFGKLAEKDTELQCVAALCRSLNSYSANKIDEPDFDARLQAFSMINEQGYKSFSLKEWRPIVYNMLFFIRDTEELAIRSSASFALRRFIEANLVDIEDDGTMSSDLTKTVILPALRKGASDTSEIVRAEYLAVMAHLVRFNPEWHEVSDMCVLLVADDEEASFFSNVLHIQQHRRLRALRRLATETRRNRLHSRNIAHFFLPLVEHFVFDKADDENAHNLSSEAVSTIAALALALEWPQFRAVFRRYLGYIESKPDLEKTMIKLVGVLADSLCSTRETDKETLSEGPSDEATTLPHRNTLARTLPGQEKLAGDLTKNLLPTLTKYLHAKDESTVSLRVPVAVSAAKLLKMLPPIYTENQLPPILTDICNILRSRASESRDLTRKTLVDIAAVVGPAYFGFILKELRRALARGYQLHVLSYTVHSILVGTGSVFKLGDLDYCLPQIVAIVMDDTFGATGQEKDAEEYISKMKEVKSSKSYDSMEIIARSATAENFLHLIRPLQSLLDERLDLKMIRKIDELLRRVGIGLLHNETIQSRQVLMFCHEIIREAYKSGEDHGRRASGQNPRNKRFLISLTGAQKSQRGSTSSSRYKLIRFAFDLLRSILHRYDSLRTLANLAGFMPMLGDAMVSSNEEIRMSAIRLLTTIIKVPLQEIDNNAAIYVTEAVKVVKASPSTNTELSQAALKLVSAILRERRNVEVRETDLAYLLKRIQPDLEELDRQGVAFNFLKAVMTRKIVIVEVYEVLETVAAMMITNQTRGARDQARRVYFDFLVNYPQGKGRFSKQLAFLVKNLEYKHQEGRQSVMEAIHLLLSKVGEDLVQSVLESFFVPLVMVVVNDESVQCREMAGALLKTVLERADSEKSDAFLTLLRAWLSQLSQPLLVRVALQVYGIYLDTQQARAEKEVLFLFGQLTRILKAHLKNIDEADWEIIYYSLQAYIKACQKCPAASFAADTAMIWASVRQCLSFPHLWVKVSAVKLQGMLFADIARANANVDEPEMPLKGSGGIRLSRSEIEQIARASVAQLKAPTLNEELATQTVRNLVFLAKMMNSTPWEWGLSETGGKSFTEEGEAEESEGESPEPEIEPQVASGLHYIFRHASTILRRGPLTTREPALIPVKAAMQLTWALCNNLPIEVVRPSIETLLLPLQTLTDPSIPPPFSNDDNFVNGYKALITHGSEIMAMLQSKLGTTDYVMHSSKVRERIKARREGRRAKRRIEAITEPEKTGRLKKRKGEQKKEKRKEKSAGQRSRRRGW